MKGSGSRTYYVPGALFPATPDLPQSGADLPHLGADLPQSGADFGALPEDLRTRITALGRRPLNPALRELIVELCTLAPRSASELASLLRGRDPKNLVSLHLRPMKDAGTLSYLYPEMPNHPQQKHTVASEDE